MKRTWLLLCILALVPGALLSQVAPDKPPRTDRNEPVYNYTFHAGFAYTSLNQVNLSRHGLIGFDLQFSRQWGRYFSLVGDAAYFPTSYTSGNPGDPKVSMFLAGPELRAALYGKVNGYFHGLLGMERTTGVGINPESSFAGGPGGGLEYALSPRMLIRAEGDYILASFSLTNNSPQDAFSPHMHGNARASVGISYRF